MLESGMFNFIDHDFIKKLDQIRENTAHFYDL